ncbi:MAG: ion transporter [Polyangiales bacterium]
MQRLRRQLHHVIFEADTTAGKAFDVALIATILFSTVVVMAESVTAIRLRYGTALQVIEWVVTVLFTLEYGLRLLSVQSPWRYASSFYGIVDLLSILPTYASAVTPGAQYLVVIRMLRILRVFRVLKLAHHVREFDVLLRALYASRRKITVFLLAVVNATVILGSLMYLVEGERSGFTSIPRSIYWAIVTLTTVGYGDISPKTAWGQTLASTVMILGYAIIAVPTGIVSVELARAEARKDIDIACISCGRQGHEDDALHCKYCGARLER